MKELILNFHGVGAVPSAVDRAEAAVWWDEAPFLRALDEIAASAPKFEYPIALTFDDGNASDAEIALPALIKRGLKATFFVCAGRVGTANYLDAVDIAKLLQRWHDRWQSRHESCRLATCKRSGAGQRNRRCADAARGYLRPGESTLSRFHSAHTIAALFGRLKRTNWRCVYSSDGGFARANAWFKPRQTLSRASEGQDIIPQIRAKDTLRKTLWRRLVGLLKRCR